MEFTITSIEEDMSNEDYHKVGAGIISSSFVKDVAKHSVGKAIANTESLKVSHALIFGSAFHTAMEDAGVEGMLENFHVLPAIDKRTTEYKKAFSEAQEQGISEQRIINEIDVKVIRAMRKSVLQNEMFADLNKNPYIDELLIFGTHNGIDYRVRPDRLYYTDDSKTTPLAIVDYKTCQDVTKFKKDAFTYMYPVQAIFYADFLGIDPKHFYFVAVEKSKPYTSQVFRLSPKTIESARKLMETAIQQIEAWKKSDIIPSINKPILELI
jgi:hypothetical protein